MKSSFIEAIKEKSNEESNQPSSNKLLNVNSYVEVENATGDAVSNDQWNSIVHGDIDPTKSCMSKDDIKSTASNKVMKKIN